MSDVSKLINESIEKVIGENKNTWAPTDKPSYSKKGGSTWEPTKTPGGRDSGSTWEPTNTPGGRKGGSTWEPTNTPGGRSGGSTWEPTNTPGAGRDTDVPKGTDIDSHIPQGAGTGTKAAIAAHKAWLYLQDHPKLAAATAAGLAAGTGAVVLRKRIASAAKTAIAKHKAKKK